MSSPTAVSRRPRPASSVPLHARVALLVGAVACCSGSPAAVRTPMGGGGAVELEPVPATQAPRTWRRLVFTCTSPGLVVFADRPCGPLGTVREVTLRVSADATPPGNGSTAAPPARAASTRPAPERHHPDPPSADDERQRRTEACHRLEEAVHALDARMRSGYSAREAARLWSRWREAKERLRESDC